jgi:hypothetical protein
MKNVVNPSVLSISTDLEKDGCVISKSAIVNVKIREHGFSGSAHTIVSL